MIYETKTQYTIIDKNGNDKVVKENFLIEEASFFGDAEAQTYKYCDGKTDIDVIAVKRSKIKEIINARADNDEKIFVADIADIRTNDEGEETEIIYKVALFANNFDKAKAVLTEYLKQGYDMQIVGLKCTKFVDTI